jgi:hypothetical protein
MLREFGYDSPQIGLASSGGVSLRPLSGLIRRTRAPSFHGANGNHPRGPRTSDVGFGTARLQVCGYAACHRRHNLRGLRASRAFSHAEPAAEYCRDEYQGECQFHHRHRRPRTFSFHPGECGPCRRPHRPGRGSILALSSGDVQRRRDRERSEDRVFQPLGFLFCWRLFN